MQSKNTSYLPRLDHLRFFAALLVCVYHFHGGAMDQNLRNPLVTVIREGETGVSLFMVLSGFIMARIAMGKQINYRSFIYNRILRIYPLYLVMIFVAAFSGGRHVDPISFIALVLPIANLGNVVLPKFPHIWTIAVEFQFYLAFPFIAAFLARYGIRYLLGLIGFAIVVRAMMYLTDGTIQDGAYWTILGRIDQFAIGMIAAAIYSKPHRWLSSPLSLIAALGIIWGWFALFTDWTGGFYGKNAMASMAWIVSPTLEASVWAVMALAYLQQKWVMPAAINKTLSYLGALSFSMYMWRLLLLCRNTAHTSQEPHGKTFS
jgi:peptidoglycan/LPS O-acetylase OafA/YrhL